MHICFVCHGCVLYEFLDHKLYAMKVVAHFCFIRGLIRVFASTVYWSYIYMVTFVVHR